LLERSRGAAEQYWHDESSSVAFSLQPSSITGALFRGTNWIVRTLRDRVGNVGLARWDWFQAFGETSGSYVLHRRIQHYPNLYPVSRRGKVSTPGLEHSGVVNDFAANDCQ